MPRVCIGLYSGGAFYGIMPICLQISRPTLITIQQLLKLTLAKLVIRLENNTDIQRSDFLPQQLGSHNRVIAVWPRYRHGN